MIVIVGGLAWRLGDEPAPAGRACEIALAAAALGARVEVVGRAGDDPTGDAVMLGLARAGIGHVAVLRDPSRPTPVIEALAATDDEPGGDQSGPAPAAIGPALDAADVSLGLQYLTAFGVLVVTDDVPSAAIPVAIESAGFTGAHLILLTAADADPPDVSGQATILAAPDEADDGAFARLVGTYAAGLDHGAEPARAFAAAVDASGWEALEPSV
ncbi:MAG TPA: hypothetical protein VIZ22_13170 [Candidatus Limnocylindrales bacterium]